MPCLWRPKANIFSAQKTRGKLTIKKSNKCSILTRNDSLSSCYQFVFCSRSFVYDFLFSESLFLRFELDACQGNMRFIAPAKINSMKWKKNARSRRNRAPEIMQQIVQESFLLQALAGLVEIPAIGIAMYIIMKTGKKWLFSATFLATGISCFLAAVFEGNVHMLWLKITFVMIGERSVLFCHALVT